MHSNILYCNDFKWNSVQRSAIRFSTVQHSAVQYSAEQCNVDCIVFSSVLFIVWFNEASVSCCLLVACYWPKYEPYSLATQIQPGHHMTISHKVTTIIMSRNSRYDLFWRQLQPSQKETLLNLGQGKVVIQACGFQRKIQISFVNYSCLEWSK